MRVVIAVLLLGSFGCERDLVGVLAKEAESKLEALDASRVGGDALLDRAAVAAPVLVPLGVVDSPVMLRPARVAAGPDGTIAVADPRAQQVHLFDATGRLRRSLTVDHPIAVAFDARGRLYVGDAKSAAVIRFSEDWERQGLLGNGRGQVLLPSGMAYDPFDDELHVTDSASATVTVFRGDGSFARNYGSSKPSDGGLESPTGIVADGAANAFYVLDRFGTRVQVYDRDGTWLRAFSAHAETAELSHPDGLTRDDAGRLYTVDHRTNEVHVFDVGGRSIATLGTAQGFDFEHPSDATIDGHGRLWVASESGRLSVWGIDKYTEPTRTYAQAEVTVHAEDPSPQGRVTVLIEIPECGAEDIVWDTVRFNGVAPTGEPQFGDANDNGVTDLVASFPRRELGLGDVVLPATPAVLTGTITGGCEFQGETPLTATP